MSGRGDVGRRLSRALIDSARASACWIRVGDSSWTSWASACFEGARHRLVLIGQQSSALDVWLGDLPETELAMAGHLVADLVVAGVSRDRESVRIDLEVLTVDDR